MDVAQQFENASSPMHHEWLVENHVTLDECGALCDKLAAIIKGYLQSPHRIQLAVLACSAVDEPEMAEHIVHVMERNRVLKRLGAKVGVIGVLSLLFVTGCCTPYLPVPSGPPAECANTGYMVVNNTGVKLDLVQDGHVIVRSLEPGRVMPLRPLLFQRHSVVVAVGYDGSAYIGTDTFTFDSRVAETWVVTRLIPPGN